MSSNENSLDKVLYNSFSVIRQFELEHGQTFGIDRSVFIGLDKDRVYTKKKKYIHLTLSNKTFPTLYIFMTLNVKCVISVNLVLTLSVIAKMNLVII